jgi:hypothetical protein
MVPLPCGGQNVNLIEGENGAVLTRSGKGGGSWLGRGNHKIAV